MWSSCDEAVSKYYKNKETELLSRCIICQPEKLQFTSVSVQNVVTPSWFPTTHLCKIVIWMLELWPKHALWCQWHLTTKCYSYCDRVNKFPFLRYHVYKNRRVEKGQSLMPLRHKNCGKSLSGSFSYSQEGKERVKLKCIALFTQIFILLIVLDPILIFKMKSVAINTWHKWKLWALTMEHLFR